MTRLDAVKARAHGRWPFILDALRIDVPDNPKKHGPCPACGGKDRFRFDDLDGHGTFFCNQCDPQAGDGFTLVKKVLRLSFPDTIRKVEEILGHAPTPLLKRSAPPREENGAARICEVPAGELGTSLFEYTDATGKPVFYVQRVELGDGKKTFPQWGPTKDGQRWQANLKYLTGLKPLYQLQPLGADISRLVVAHEGEKAVHAHLAAGLPGIPTTSSGGAGKGHLSDWSPVKGRQVVICPDHDTAGDEHAAQVTQLAHAAGALSVRVVQLPGLPLKGDIVEWLAAGGTSEQFQHLMDAAPTLEPPALPEPTHDAPADARELELSRLASLAPAAYGFERKAASDRLGIPLDYLDQEREVRRKAEKKSAPGQGQEIAFEDIPPAWEPVKGEELSDQLAAVFTKFAVLPPHGADALALWVLFTYCYDEFEIAPRLDLRSPEKGCGKTTVLGLLHRLVWRGLLSSNLTPSTIFRVVSAHTPTLLIDEMDTFTDVNEELRGILNSGHTRDGAIVIRNVGEQHEPRTFSTWAPMAFAHIGRIPDTLEDRSICLPMKRRTAREHIASLRQVGPAAVALRLELRTLVGQIVRWITDERARLASASPTIPDGLSDRAKDNWLPLLSLAEVLGGSWPERAREAALSLSGQAAMENESQKVQLLSDIQGLFDRQAVGRFSSEDLCTQLALLEERPWSEWRKGKPITPTQLARLLRPFSVVSRTIRFSGQGLAKGYLPEDFADAFERYLPSLPPDSPLSKRNTVTTHSQSGDEPLFQSVTEGACYVSKNGPNPAPGAGCYAVTDQNQESGEEEELFEDTHAARSD